MKYSRLILPNVLIFVQAPGKLIPTTCATAGYLKGFRQPGVFYET